MSGPRRPRRLAMVGAMVLVLATLIAVIEGTSLFTAAPPPPTGRLPVFSFSEPDLGAVEVLWRGRAGNLVRDARGEWLRHDTAHRHADAATQADHAADPLEARRIAEQLAVTARMLYDRRMTPDRPLAAYGLERPAIMVAFYGRRGNAAEYSRPLAVLYVGDLLTTGYAYYALLDGATDITLIPRYQVALLLALLFGEENAPALQPPKKPAG